MAIAAPNGAAASFAFLGVVYGGSHATPLNLVAGVKTLAFVLTHSKTEIILCADDSRALVDEAITEFVDKGETAPQIISMNVDDGPRWAETNITPVNPIDLDVPSADTIGLLMYTSAQLECPKAFYCRMPI